MMPRLPITLVLVATIAVACSKKKELPKDPPIAASPSASVLADKPNAAPPAPTPSTPPAVTGTIRGRVTFKGKLDPAKEVENTRDPFCEKAKPKEAKVTRVGKNNALVDVVVRVQPGTVKGDPARAPKATLSQDGCMYTPRVLGIVTGGDLELVNKDRTMHNVHGFAGDETAFNAGQAMGSPPLFRKAPNEPGIVRVKCDVHPWMVAWLIVTDHPYFTSVNDDGAFSLTAPVGAQTIEAVHPLHGTKTKKIEVQQDYVMILDFAFTDADKGPGPQ